MIFVRFFSSVTRASSRCLGKKEKIIQVGRLLSSLWRKSLLRWMIASNFIPGWTALCARRAACWLMWTNMVLSCWLNSTYQATIFSFSQFFLRNPLISCDNCFFLNYFFFHRPVGKNCDDLIVASIVSTWPPCCLSPKSGDPHEHTQDFHPRNCRDFISPLQCFTFTSTGQKVRIFKGCTAINCLLHR